MQIPTPVPTSANAGGDSQPVPVLYCRAGIALRHLDERDRDADDRGDAAEEPPSEVAQEFLRSGVAVALSGLQIGLRERVLGTHFITATGEIHAATSRTPPIRQHRSATAGDGSSSPRDARPNPISNQCWSPAACGDAPAPWRRISYFTCWVAGERRLALPDRTTRVRDFSTRVTLFHRRISPP